MEQPDPTADRGGSGPGRARRSAAARGRATAAVPGRAELADARRTCDRAADLRRAGQDALEPSPERRRGRGTRDRPRPSARDHHGRAVLSVGRGRRHDHLRDPRRHGLALGGVGRRCRPRPTTPSSTSGPSAGSITGGVRFVTTRFKATARPIAEGVAYVSGRPAPHAPAASARSCTSMAGSPTRPSPARGPRSSNGGCRSSTPSSRSRPASRARSLPGWSALAREVQAGGRETRRTGHTFFGVEVTRAVGESEPKLVAWVGDAPPP